MKYFWWILLLWVVVFLLFWFVHRSDESENFINVSDDLGNEAQNSWVVHAWYDEYDASLDLTAINEETIVLFFHADRCPTCNNIDRDIIEKWVPEWIKVLKVNFDEEKELLAKYNVLTQSSFAQIDNQWNLIKRWVGGFGIDDIVEKLEDNEVKPREEARKKQELEGAVEDRGFWDWPSDDAAYVQMVDTTADDIIQNNAEVIEDDAIVPDVQTAYFAWGCFRCIEWPFEAMDGVLSAVSGYAEWTEETASYTFVWRWNTKHREAVMVTYDPSKVSYEELVQTYRYQIDPTDAGGQFADRWYHYTTAIYYQTPEEQSIAQESKDTMNLSWKFDEPIAVLIRPFTTFFEAEEEHQDYYLKQSAHYQRYKKWSGRAGFIDDNRWQEIETTWERENEESEGAVDDRAFSEWASDFQWWIGEDWLDEMQRKVVFEEWTEPPFDNKYRDHKEAWIYVDILDGTPLFSSTDKFDSGTWWPSFTTPIDTLLIELEEDKKYGMVRTEVETANDTHLGHVFNDGPGWSQRYCINSAALDFVALEKMEEMGYGEYLVLFD